MVRVPKHRRHKRSRQAVVTLYGKDFYLGKYGTKESHDNYSMLIAEYHKGKGEEVPPELILAKRARKNITVVEAADRYLAYFYCISLTELKIIPERARADDFQLCEVADLY